MSTPRPPYDPELQAALLAYIAEFDPPKSYTPDTIFQLRAISATIGFDPKLLTEVDREDHVIVGYEGVELDVVVIRPKGSRIGPRLPGMLFVHGGGMVAGNRFIGLADVADWMEAVPMVVVSVEYRYAPEHPHPIPVEDCYAALCWMARCATDLGIDEERLAVAGGSAGAGIAAAVTLMARDRGGPELMAQLLMSPMLDDRAVTPSSGEFVGEGTWDMISNATGWAALLGDRAAGLNVSPYAAAARADSLAGLPPTYVDVGSAEIFRDEDVEFASRIWAEGGVAELHVWPGGFHGFDSLAPGATLSREARDAKLNWLRRTFAV